jgi:hypothetical protein
MKRQLLSLHPLNQFLDPINRWLIRDARRQETMMLDFLVDLVAILTHGPRPSGGSERHLWDTLQIQGHLVPSVCKVAGVPWSVARGIADRDRLR